MSHHIKDLRLASSLTGLGFIPHLRAVVHARGGQRSDEVECVFEEAASMRFPALHLGPLLRAWLSGSIRRTDVVHPLAVAMRAQRVLNALNTAQQVHTLPQLTTHDQLSYSYDPDGTPLPSPLSPLSSPLSPLSYPLTDLALTAALVPLGFPVLSIDGPHGAHCYHVPALGLPIRDSAGVLTRYHAARLTQRAPTRTDPYRLALEDTEPLHPLCIGYDVLTARALIKSTFKKVRPALIIGTDQSPGQAIIDIDYQGHVGEAVCRHLQCAPSALD